MADLDADLYGDLYESAKPEDEELVVTPFEDDEELQEPPSKPAVSAYASSSTIVAPKTTLAPPPPQQIPTYEEGPRDHQLPPRAGGIGGGNGLIPMGVRPSDMKEEGKMFIGGLHWDTTDEGLRDYFSQFGKVDACTIMRDPTGRSRCFAFLTFEDPASVNAVMVQEHVLDGKIIDPKRAIPRTEHQKATKLFIGGLAATVTSESMREFFAQFGKVLDSTVMMDRETGRSKGFGFISLEDVDVTPFLGFGNLEIDGKLIDVKLAEPRYRRDEADGTNQNVGGGYGNQQLQQPGAAAANFAAAAAGGGMMNSAFDPQMLANLYTRMFQMAGGMGGAAGGAAGGAGAAAGGMMNAMNMQMNPMMNMMGAMAGMRGGGPMGGGRGMMRGGMNMGGVPRGPRGGGTVGGGGGGAMGVGPQRGPPRGNHQYHPYSR